MIGAGYEDGAAFWLPGPKEWSRLESGEGFGGRAISHRFTWPSNIIELSLSASASPALAP